MMKNLGDYALLKEVKVTPLGSVYLAEHRFLKDATHSQSFASRSDIRWRFPQATGKRNIPSCRLAARPFAEDLQCLM